MVNLPAEEVVSHEVLQAAGLERSNPASGTASGSQVQYKEPTSILELEMQAACVAHRMSAYMEADNHYEFAVKWLREYYNLTFKMLCPKCKTAHAYDELEAPER